MDDGKSPTWFAYARSALRENDMIHYISKTDSDTVMFLDKYFLFVEEHLPPPPYNRNTFAGRPWQLNRRNPGKDRHSYEKYRFKFQPYMQGQWYLMSTDLADTIVEETPKSKDYSEHFEDHDIGMMVLHSERPIHFIALQIGSTHWEHPIKTKRRHKFNLVWDNEINRYSHLVSREVLVHLENKDGA